jgi:DNA polymerase-3 subunit delta
MIIFLYGEDTYRSRQKLKEIKDKFLREVDPGGSSVVAIDGENATMEKINETTGAPSLFTKKRMIIIERLFASKNKAIFDQLYNYLQQSPSLFKDSGIKKKGTGGDNIIVFWDDIAGKQMANNKLWQFLSRQRYTQNFKTLSNTEATDWIKKEIKARGAKIRHQAAFSLTSLLGSNLWQLSNEINKLISYKRGQQKGFLAGDKDIIIEGEDIEELVRGNFNENIFALTDAVSNKKKSLAIKLFEQEIEAGITESHLIFMVIRQFRILLQVRQSLDKGHTARKIIRQLGLHPFVVQKCLTQVRNFSLPTLKNILRRLIVIDKEIKSGQAESKSALGMLIARF